MSKFTLRMTLMSILTVGATSGWASQPTQVGQPPFQFTATYAGSPRLGQPIRLRISFFGFYDESAVSDMRIDVPSGMEVIEGSTTLRTSPASEVPWFISVMPRHPGRYEIHGSIRTVAKTHVDEAEFILPIEVRKDELIVGLYEPTRIERIEGGRRYRYGYAYLVPIEGPQRITQEDIERENGKPTVLQDGSGICAECALPEPVVVSYRVLVDERGSLREAEALSDPSVPDPVVRAARAALAGWRFKPARAKGIATPDRLIVGVTVR